MLTRKNKKFQFDWKRGSSYIIRIIRYKEKGNPVKGLPLVIYYLNIICMPYQAVASTFFLSFRTQISNTITAAKKAPNIQK